MISIITLELVERYYFLWHHEPCENESRNWLPGLSELERLQAFATSTTGSMDNGFMPVVKCSPVSARFLAS